MRYIRIDLKPSEEQSSGGFRYARTAIARAAIDLRLPGMNMTAADVILGSVSKVVLL